LANNTHATTLQERTRVSAIGLVSLLAYVIFRGPHHAPRDGERRSRHTRSRHTNRICLSSTACDDD